MTKIKICGLRRMEDIEIVNEYLPDYIGFVFAKGKRTVTLEEAKVLKEKLNKEILAIGVYVNAPMEEILLAAEEKVIDMIQLHGDEDEEYILKLKKNTSLPIVKAVRVKSKEVIEEAEHLPCDYILLDSYHKSQYGGSGKTFDYNLIPLLKKPCFLAGGLNIENIEDAINIVKPFGADISSGVENDDGYKDRDMIKKIIEITRQQ